jgi:hypothetical protein
MPELSAVVRRFPMHELALNRLYARDADFRGLCDDHATALGAIRHWEARGPDFAARVEEYRQLLVEIEAEIEAAIVASEPPGRGYVPAGRSGA